jgi:plasmid stabilization system protein ParE
MVKSVKWNNRALRKMRDIINYLKTNVSNKVANDFVDAVYYQINRLREQPEIGRPVVTTKTIRFINVDKHRQMFYRIKGSTLHISNFFDTRQDPDKRPY